MQVKACSGDWCTFDIDERREALNPEVDEPLQDSLGTPQVYALTCAS
jgi:hypothetical protein